MKIQVNQRRAFAITSIEANESSPFITLSLSSEQPVQRAFGAEVLLHGSDNVDLSRAMGTAGLPLLVNHNDGQLPVGRIKNIRIDPDKKLRGDAYFSGRAEAQAVRDDVVAGIVSDVSIGYKIQDYKIVRGKEGASDTYNVTRWMPFEGSLVSVAADSSVGVGRSDDETLEIEETKEPEETRELGLTDGGLKDVDDHDNETDFQRVEKDKNENLDGQDQPEDEARGKDKKPYGDVAYADPEDGKYPLDTVEHIKAAWDYINIAKNAAELGDKAAAVKAAIVAAYKEKVDKDGPPSDRILGGDKPTPAEAEPANEDSALCGTATKSLDTSVELLTQELIAVGNVALNLNVRSQKEIDAVLALKPTLAEARKLLLEPKTQATPITEGKKMLNPNLIWKSLDRCLKGDFNFIEGDNSDVKEIIQRTSERGFKANLFHDSFKRDMTVTADANAVFQVPIGFLDILRARTVCLKAGTKTRTGVGSLAYLRESAAVLVSGHAEDAAAPAATALSFTKVPYTPKALIATVPITDELQKESTYDLQAVLRGDMVKQFALSLDYNMINGVTSPYAITGLLNGGIQNGSLAAAAAPAFLDINNLKALVDKYNVDLDTCSYILRPEWMAALETTPKFTAGMGWPIADRNQINGYKAFTTSNIPQSGNCSGGQCSLSGTTATLTTAPTVGSVAIGQEWTGTGIPAGTTVLALLTGTLNAVSSTYQLSASCTTESAENFTGVTTSSVIFGDFSNLELCLQGPTEFMVDNITQFQAGIVIITAKQYHDVGVLQPNAFSYVGNYLI